MSAQPKSSGERALVASGTPSSSSSGAVVAAVGNGANGKGKNGDQTAVVVYEEGTVGHLVQSEDLPAPPPAVARNKLLAEEDYTETLEHIIERDYFPHVAKLRAEAAYLDAMNDNDVDRMRTIAAEYSRSVARTGASGTPSLAGETPRFAGATPRSIPLTPGTRREADPNFAPEDPLAPAKGMKLDSFLAMHTSEDNAAYEVIMAKDSVRRRQKHAWLYKEDKKVDAPLAITAAGEGKNGSKPDVEAATPAIEMWDYKAKNALMYYPEATQSVMSKEQLAKANTKEIRAHNTRLAVDVFKKPAPVDKTKMTFEEMTTRAPGMIDPRGNQITAPSPQVGGYGFVTTPAHGPGPDASPFMTWGEIESTPFRIETDIDMTPGPQFTMHPMSTRERIGKELADKVTKKTDKSNGDRAAKGSTARASPYPTLASQKLVAMSPAAQRLANATLGLTPSNKKSGRSGSSSMAKASSLLMDPELRKAYSPSPAASAVGVGMGSRLRSGSARGLATPSALARAAATPTAAAAAKPTAAAPSSRSAPATSAPSLTDNLLDISSGGTKKKTG